jgi:hypothetical protein
LLAWPQGGEASPLPMLLLISVLYMYCFDLDKGKL